jgi:hypothetical protein
VVIVRSIHQTASPARVNPWLTEQVYGGSGQHLVPDQVYGGSIPGCPIRCRVRAVLGSARKREQTNPPARADQLAGIVLPDHDGNDVRLGDLWQDGPAALVWLRHYG